MTGLFWNGRTQSVTKAEAERFTSPEETGRRLVINLHAWLSHALDELPTEAREWYRIELEPPEWLDPGHPNLALNECRRLVNGIPQHRAGWHACSEDDAKRILEAGKSRIAKAGGVDPDKIADSEVLLIKLSPDAARAVAVLHAARSAVAATASLPAPAALVLLERALDFGIELARAHVEPWESFAALGRGQMETLRRGRDNAHGTPEQRAALYHAMQEELEAIMREKGWLITAAREELAYRHKGEHGFSLRNIIKHTKRPRKI